MKGEKERKKETERERKERKRKKKPCRLVYIILKWNNKNKSLYLIPSYFFFLHLSNISLKKKKIFKLT